MRWRIPLLLSLIGIVAVSCDQQPVDPTTDQAAEAPSFDWTNNPDNGNIKVYRDGFDFVLCWSDEENGLRACHGTVPLGQGGETDCGLQQAEAPLSYQDVGFLNPDDFCANDLKAHQQGDVWITIRDTNAAGDCFENALVAEGWGKIRVNDNDICGVDENDPSGNVWSFRSQGTLTTVGGETVTYNGLLHRSYNNSVGDQENRFVNLH